MRKKTFFIYSILFALIFIMVPKISYSKKKAARPIIYGSEAASEAAKADSPRKEYKAKIGIIKRETDLRNGYHMRRNSKGFFVPVSISRTLNKDDLVLVYKGEDDKHTSRVYVFSDAPEPRGRIKKEDISYDIKDFKNGTQVFLINSIPGYEEIDGKRLEENVSGYGIIEDKKDGWLKVFFVGRGDYWIKESDMNYDYNSVEHEDYDLIF